MTFSFLQIFYFGVSMPSFTKEGVSQRSFFSYSGHWFVQSFQKEYLFIYFSYNQLRKIMIILYPFVALFAITLGPGDSTHEIYKDSIAPLSQALESSSESSKISSVCKIV